MIELMIQVFMEVRITYLSQHNQLPAVLLCLWRLSHLLPSVKRPALENYMSERICYAFLMSKCREDFDHFSLLAKREALRNGDFRIKTYFARRKNRNLALRSASVFASIHKEHRPTSQSPLHFDIRNI